MEHTEELITITIARLFAARASLTNLAVLYEAQSASNL